MFVPAAIIAAMKWEKEKSQMQESSESLRKRAYTWRSCGALMRVMVSARKEGNLSEVSRMSTKSPSLWGSSGLVKAKGNSTVSNAVKTSWSWRSMIREELLGCSTIFLPSKSSDRRRCKWGFSRSRILRLEQDFTKKKETSTVTGLDTAKACWMYAGDSMGMARHNVGEA